MLDLGDNRKVITDYRNHRIIRILIDLIVSSGYLSGVLQEAPSFIVRLIQPCKERAHTMTSKVTTMVPERA